MPPLAGYRGLMLRRARPGFSDRFWLKATAGSLAFLACCAAVRPAQAQVAGSLSISTREMFRGESLSGTDPALSASVSLDSGSGLFAGASASLAPGDDGMRFVSLVQYAGYARRIGQVSAELGVIHRTYDTVVDTAYRRGYFEAYAGLSFKAIKGRVYISPDYLVDGRNTYYVEVNARLFKSGPWSLDGHGGLSLIPYDLDTGRHGLQRYQDWRVQISRPVGPVFLSIGVNGTNYPVFSASGKASVFASISHAF